MAGKQFHITPDGPKRCTATFRACPYADHYATVESALVADRILAKDNARRAELKRLHDSHRNPDPKFFSRSSFFFGRNSSSPRDFGNEIDHRVKALGVKPEIFHSVGQFRLNNGSGSDVNIQIMRMTEIDEARARYAGVWRVINKTGRTGMINHMAVKADVLLDFSSEQSGRRSMLQARELFRSAVISSGVYNAEDADRQADEMSIHFKNMFNAVESDAAGDFDLWDRGMGYFTESDSETIIVNQPYSTSAFRAENFKNFIAENPYYSSSQPEAEIRVGEAHNLTGASWVIRKSSGQWAVEKVYTDGGAQIIPVSTPQEALDQVYYHNLTDVNPDDKTAALERGRYAASLMEGVEEALEENRAVVDEWWRDQEARKKASSEGNITKEMYDLGIEPKGSLMGKLFDTFT